MYLTKFYTFITYKCSLCQDADEGKKRRVLGNQATAVKRHKNKDSNVFDFDNKRHGKSSTWTKWMLKVDHQIFSAVVRPRKDHVTHHQRDIHPNYHSLWMF